MKVIVAVSLSLSLMYLVGCTPKQESTADSQASFQKKIECEKYASVILEEFRTSGEVMPGGSSGSYYVERVFYSPKIDSCICVIGNSSVARGEAAYNMQMIDALTKKLLWARTYKSGELTGMADDIEAHIKAYE